MNALIKPTIFTLTVAASLVSLNIQAAADMVLTSQKTSASITLDGIAEAAWQQATPLLITLDKMPYVSDQYPGMKQTQVSIQSLYDGQTIYFYMKWQDPTHSLARYPWVKQPDGSWKQLKNKDQTNHENTYYEDKAALLWDINARGFAKKGCDIACHMADDNGMVNDIKQTAPGRKYTRAMGQTIDMWHWKSVRTGPTEQFDDQFIDATADPASNDNWGRKGDDKLSGGYKDNINADKTAPAYGTAVFDLLSHYAITEKMPFVDTFKAGDMLPGIVVEPFTGSRGDISAKGVWKDGSWHLEFKRQLGTSGENSASQDVQFSDLTKPYPFGVSVFDNSQINHLYHEGVFTLMFAK
ncbi:ethylbenzene dehydrogenase-related protein [Motilimonas sp. E26]|uniref:ethylbenzene dehydrogenase-related protein n=1 Tax=Motilimonas sp. E26 TaxID=2865674 RepID=UPI001E5F1344|nr:ethylbenzene dehydrogenase-related protein [Motilimonas sp. E26]MCE0559158.1 ethylbenzene dehydrogenase [Motilimonas sp. E26]